MTARIATVYNATADQSDATQVRFDPATKTGSFRSLMNGKPVHVCEKQIVVPESDAWRGTAKG